MSVRRTLAALGALLLLAGCGGDPKPKVEQTPTSPTTSPTQSETAKPASAEDVIRQYVELSLEAQNTGDSSEFAEAFPACRACQKLAQSVTDAYTRGGFIDSGTWRIRSIKLAGSVGARYEYNLVVDADAGRFRPKEGAPVQHFPGGITRVRMILNKAADRWVLKDTLAM